MTNVYAIWKGLACTLAIGAYAGLVQAQGTSVQITASKDNTLYESTSGATSNGAGIHFFVGKTNGGSIRRGLVAFDLSEIPQGATISSVTLTLNMSKTNIAAPTTSISLHRVLADWGEATSDATGQEGRGAAATPDDATWIHRFFNTDTWNTAGGDFQSTTSGIAAVSGVASYTWGSTNEMVADVQSWVDNPEGNFGWLLKGNESSNTTAKRFDTRENASAANRPILNINFIDPTNVEDRSGQTPTGFAMAQNYPNPFNPTTQINYAIARSGRTQIEIFNILGSKVRTLVNAVQPAGTYRVRWDGKNDGGAVVANGVYVYRLRAGSFVDMKKMLFVK